MGGKIDKNMPKSKKLKVFLLVIIMILILLMVALYSSFGISKLAELSNVENLKAANATNNYIAISTPQEFMNIANNLSGNYILMNDIDMTGIDYTAIGNEDNPFTGKLNGNGYKISNIEDINYQRYDNNYYPVIGLFGNISGGTVENLIIKDLKIEDTGTENGRCIVGGLAGIVSNNAVISNVHIVGDSSIYLGMSRNVDSAGGLIGDVTGADILNCSTDINITAENNTINAVIGGLVGRVFSSSNIKEPNNIKECHSNSNIYVDFGNYSEVYRNYGNTIGGLIGEYFNEKKSIFRLEKSYSTGNIIATAGYLSYAGGLMGRCADVLNVSTGIKGTGTAYISNVYSRNNISIDAKDESHFANYVGGLIGHMNTNSNSKLNCTYASGNIEVLNNTETSYGIFRKGGLIGYNDYARSASSSYRLSNIGEVHRITTNRRSFIWKC